MKFISTFTLQTSSHFLIPQISLSRKFAHFRKTPNTFDRGGGLEREKWGGADLRRTRADHVFDLLFPKDTRLTAFSSKSILAMGAQSAAIDCILGHDPQVWVPQGSPPLATVLAQADIAPAASRIAWAPDEGLVLGRGAIFGKADIAPAASWMEWALDEGLALGRGAVLWILFFFLVCVPVSPEEERRRRKGIFPRAFQIGLIQPDAREKKKRKRRKEKKKEG